MIIKKILFLMLVLLVISCKSINRTGTADSRQKFGFKNYREILLRPNIVQSFTRLYSVWNKESYLEWELTGKPPVKDYIAYETVDFKKSYVVKNEITNDFVTLIYNKEKSYSLKKECYIIKTKNISFEIIQKYIDNDYCYEIFYNNKYYILENFDTQINKGSRYFVFNLKESDSNKEIAIIYKNNHFFKNEYNIIINLDYSDFSELMHIGFAVILDIKLLKSGYEFK